MQQNSNLTEEDIKALEILHEEEAREAQARFLIGKYGYDEDSVIDFEHAVELVMEALKK